ncbi:thiamine pyrophosphokinase 1-like isoform X2 [Watersipora subatra]|uniref:thiamine pyrophosphokinase 1-like isoform X2 n=1 Tax=Watersipora subatra TaxID=2589382 RepID=UPI00355B90FA
MVCHWYPRLFRHGGHTTSFQDLTSSATLKAAVDGGLNFLFDMVGTEECYWPDVITGDFDSARPEVLDFYRRKGVSIRETKDQDYTDFSKCLTIVSSMCSESPKNILRIVVFGAYGSRLDHQLSNISSLVRAHEFTNLPICLLDANQLAFLLREGEHEIHVDDIDEVEWCGLVPVVQPVLTSTNGLKWNLDNHTMACDGLISTSNQISDQQVKVKCNGCLLWMMGFL